MRSIAVILTLGLATGGNAQSACALVADIHAGTKSSDAKNFTCAFGGSLLFGARTASGWGLYRASPNGQVQLLAKDANTTLLTPCCTPQGARVFFTAKTDATGTELFSTDGTVNGTKLIRDIRPGRLPPVYGRFTAFGDRMLFVVYDFVLGTEPYVTDGTTAGTVRLKDIRPGLYGSDPRDITPAGDYALFSADDGSIGRELWITDGTPAGTNLLKNIGGAVVSFPKHLVRLGNRVVFSAHEPNSGREIWISDGTPAGTRLLADINPGSASGHPYWLTVVGDRVFFGANDGTHGKELWSTDGTTDGTKMVKDLVTGSSDPAYLSSCNGKLYYAALGPTQGRPHVSDGTAAGTFELSSTAKRSRGFIAADGKVFFTASDFRGGELWVTDGTAAGTFLPKDIYPGRAGSQIQHITATGSGVCFDAVDGVTGAEPWFSDGTATGTVRLCDVNSGSGSSYPQYFATCGGRLFFQATRPSTGHELFWIPRPGATTEDLGGASEPSRPVLTVENSGNPILGNSLRIVGNGPSNHLGLLFLGLATNLPLAPIPGLLSRGCDWVSALGPTSIILTATGTTSLSLPFALPSSPSLAGLRVNLQAWWLPLSAPLQFRVSNGLQWALGPGTPG